MFTSLKNMYIETRVALAVLLIATTTPLYADTDVDVVEVEPEHLTLTKLTENLYSLTGGVGAGDCDRITPLLPDHPFTIILESPGGSLREAVCLSLDIKARDVITVVRDTPQMDENGIVLYQPDYDGDGYVVCASACSLFFLAGDVRYLMGDVYFGLHGPGVPDDSVGVASEFYAQGVQDAGMVILLLQRLGVEDDDVRLLVIRIPSKEMLWLRPDHFEEMEGLRYIANHYVNFWGLTATNPHTRIGEYDV